MKINALAFGLVALAGSVAMAQPANTAVGADPLNYTNVSATPAGQVAWWSFSITQSIGPGTGRFMTIDTLANTFAGGSFGTGDSELALYDAVGARLGQWDDTGAPNTPRERVLFGDAAAATIAGQINFATQTTVLNPGTYYIASAPFNMVNATTGWGVTVTPSFPTGGAVTGNAGINIVSNIPAPGSLALLGLGGLIAARRRRA